ncbi:glycosyltransferase family 1 protein [Mycolicibacterium neoaurum]|uniref:glycosyltransferase n=1 Tax=Mycolicibacterium neoaurum TaxID=1795 RepID=UPI001BD1B3AF|nr:glycosyltransferase [Mycolicibacterium neoaurum]QVI28259.1 glycosyltransferase family 1 protein [Mycolicibacterium neoaurum]
MAVILAYTAPALGHLYPFCALLTELAGRGHRIHVRTLVDGTRLCRRLGFAVEPVDPTIESVEHDRDEADISVLRAATDTVRVLTRRAALEVADIRRAVEMVRPDLVIVDSNSWGAISYLETEDVPWLVLSPFTPYLRAPGLPPFGAGARPWRGPWGRIRDHGIGTVTRRVFDRPFADGIAPVRTDLGLPAVQTADELLRRAPAVLVATGKPFEYRQTDWGPNVHMIGPAAFDPVGDQEPAWLADIDRPIVLVTTSSVPQADARLVGAAIEALEGLGLHLVATSPAGPVTIPGRPGVTLATFVPHSLLLEHAVCVVTHGGMGITQKALSRGIPVCVVPFGRDQFEVARRVEVAGCGTRLPARRLTPARLRTAILDAMSMSGGAATVARGFTDTGGVPHGADIVEAHLHRGGAAV